MGYVQALALLPTKTIAYVQTVQAAVGLDAPNAVISAIADGLSKATIDGMSATDFAAQHPGLAAGTALSLETLMTLGTVPAAITAFDDLLP